MNAILKLASILAFGVTAYSANATSLTVTSPSGTNVVSRGASTIGGVVTELKGANGASVVSQLASSTLYYGFSTRLSTIGTQTGFDAAIIAALGGGLSSASFRFTLFDGDSASGDFDYADNTLLINGISVGNWSNVVTNTTDSVGNSVSAFAPDLGFANDELDTGWFHVTDSTLLSDIFSSLATTSILFALRDIDPGDNIYDFTRGIDQSLINVGSGPVVVPPPNLSPVPVPAAFPLMASALGLFGLAKRRKSA